MVWVISDDDSKSGCYLDTVRSFLDEYHSNNIKPIQNPIQKINQISGNSFVWDEEKQNIYKGKDYGVIAQEIQSILPDIVTEQSTGVLAVNPDNITWYLVNAVKELSAKIEELETKLESK